MKALVVSPGTQRTLRLADLPLPKPDANQLLLRVLKVGICGTDRDIVEGFYGSAPAGSDYLVIGHESLCRVEESDDGSSFRKGQLVVPTVRRNCNENCQACSLGMSDMCLTGNYKEHGIKELHGFASEFALTDYNFVVKLPDTLSETGVLLEPLTIAEKGIRIALAMQSARLPIRPEKALVLGAGPVGLLATALLRLMGLEVHTVATRPEESLKAKLVRQTGAEYINSKLNPLQNLENRYDLVLELTGNVQVAMEAQRLVRPNGIVSFLGIYREALASQDIGNLFTSLVLGNRIYFGSVNANRQYFETGRDHLVEIQRMWPSFLSSMITGIYRPEDFEEAYMKKDEEEIKSIITFE
ncbi:MAG: glucose 1-dehydrogenase [Conexivisphaerales archaeon]